MKNSDSTLGEFQTFLAQAKASGGAEIANCQPFVERLCQHLTLPRPDFAKEENGLNDYVFERRVAFKHSDGSSTTGRIDLYKRNCFILEAKQSSKRKPNKPSADQLAFLPEEASQHKLGHAKQGTRSWDKVMVAAKKQAEDYARALPVEHGYPPFLLIADIGNVIEVFADFSGQGKNYAHFPDRQSFRLSMDDLLLPDVQDRLRAIWTDPLSLDPAKKSAEVTRDIADRLAKIAKRLEVRHDPKEVAEFLMRCLFTMFPEDVGLIPDKGFEKLLGEIEARNPDKRVIHVIWDNAPYHKGPDVRKFLSRPGCRIHLIQLPPYCPHLNPIERLWAVMHQHVTHNRHYPTQKQFAEAILAFFRETIPDEWKNFRDQVSDNFRIITHQNFRVLAG